VKILFIGGTGLISSACSELAVRRGHALTLLNRGTTAHTPPPAGTEVLHADVRDRAAVEKVLGGRSFDAVVNWIAFDDAHVEQDLAVFGGRCGQYVFISSASAYEKPARSWPITEATPLSNPHWEYSRKKAACEARLLRAFREAKFPATIVRPSLTYGPIQIPLALGCWNAPYTLIKRARAGRPLVVPGDGTSLWTVTHNRDFALGLVGLLGNPATAGEAFHITSDEAQSWNMIYETFCRACGAEPVLCHAPSDVLIAMNPGLEGSLRGDKSESAIFDNAKMKRFVPDFRCAIPFAAGIRETVAWFDADPARQGVDAATDAFHDRVAAAMARAAA
jgi:nucleoside-diphosphate-sugar epimerase